MGIRTFDSSDFRIYYETGALFTIIIITIIDLIKGHNWVHFAHKP